MGIDRFDIISIAIAGTDTGIWGVGIIRLNFFFTFLTNIRNFLLFLFVWYTDVDRTFLKVERQKIITYFLPFSNWELDEKMVITIFHL